MSENSVKSLTPNQWDAVNFIEQEFHVKGSIPTVEALAVRLGLSESTVRKIIREKIVVDALSIRGIDLGGSDTFLSTEQLAALAVFFDTKDGRSLKKKLNDIGVSTAQWDAWKKQPAFAEHMRTRAENSLQSNLAETEVSLMDSAHRGDISAIKLHLELAGRWSSKTAGELNVDFLMMKILESIQRHVKDPDTLIALANDLASLSAPTQQQSLTAGPTIQTQQILSL